MQPKLIVAFDRLNNADFLTKSGVIVAGLTHNVNYPEPWLAQIPSLGFLTHAQSAFETAYHDALSEDKFKISHRNECRALLTGILKNIAPYFELVSQGDVSKLTTSGYDLRRDFVHNNTFDSLPAPTGFKIKHGDFSGTLDTKVDRLGGAYSYEVQITTLDPIVEENWKHALWSTAATHIHLADLIPGQSYWLRIRGIGTNGVGKWSEPVHKIVV